jgi:hypothetical protein
VQRDPTPCISGLIADGVAEGDALSRRRCQRRFSKLILRSRSLAR